LRIAGNPTFCIAVLSDVLDIYHVADHMASRGWRLNGLQRPPGFHICVTLPQTAPGLAERFVEDLRAAVAYAKNPPASPPRSGALYGGGGTGMEPAMGKDLLLTMLDATSAARAGGRFRQV